MESAVSNVTVAPEHTAKEDRGDSAFGRTVSGDVAPASASPLEWLEWQCRMLKGTIHASLFLMPAKPADGSPDNPVTLESQTRTDRIAAWPDATVNPLLLTKLALQAIRQQSPVTKPLTIPTESDGSAGQTADGLELLAMPLSFGKSRAALVLILTHRPKAERAAVVQLVEWGSHWLQFDSESEKPIVPLQQSIVERVYAQDTFNAACMELVAKLSEATDCERVSFGMRSGASLKVVAISGMSGIDSRMQLVKRIASAMHETLCQESSVESGVADVQVINQSHEKLASLSGGSCCSLLLRVDNEKFGVLLFEKSESEKLHPSTLAWCQQVADSTAPKLQSMLLEQRSMVSKTADSIQRVCLHWWPGKLTGLQVTTLLLLAGLLLASVVPGSYSVTAMATLEGRDKQVVVAPYDGFVLSASARSGESVVEGQLLATLDGRALSLERDRWLGELDKIEKSYSYALANGDRLELRLLQSQRQEIEAELALVKQKLERAKLIAPFPGVIVSGNLNRMLGAPVEAGQVLYEIASADRFRLMLEVEEHLVAHVREGKEGRIRLSAMPGNALPITLSSMMPVARVIDGQNVFRLEADFDNTVQNLRPGMRGYARIDAGERSLLWIWTQGLFNRLRVMVWSLGLL